MTAMKTTLQRLKARLVVSPHKKRQGVAILTVLAIITLMTVLVVSFFNMAQTAKVTAKGSVEIQRVTTLKDTIINLVIAQFREASKLAPVSASNPREIVTWTSQPGAIRTFSGSPTDFSRNRIYKLYSSAVPQIGDIGLYETSEVLKQINEDNAADWEERPDEFTDLNRPAYTAATGDRARATGSTDSTGYGYPIVDPRAYNGGKGGGDLQRNTEGFTYDDNSLGLVIKGVDPQREQLALPVRWIYILQDGTLGYLDSNKEFTSLNGATGAPVSRTNPMVGRLAWWADDESCKINVNTASIPAAWDTPRTTSKEDQWLAEFQPIAGEFQRYPGHPAGVDLSAVFYPNRRWIPDALAGIVAPAQNPAGGKMLRLDYEEALRVWDLAPFIVGGPKELSTGTAGTGGGQLPTPLDSTVGASTFDRLFTSLDEVYFKASGSANVSLNSPRSNLLSENKDNRLEFLKTLERSQFFLTHKSHSPELTNQGFPRVSMFPMDLLAVPAVGSTGSLPTGVSPYDVTMALNSTIGGRSSIAGGNAYFFQRRDPGSRHNEMYNGSDSRQRNTRVFRYLKELSRLPIPGYPEAVPFVVPTVTEDPAGLSLTSKYPAGVNGSGTALFGSAFGTTSLMDSSERTQILLNMLDYTRSINMQSAFLAGGDRYDDAFGKAAGICGCANAAGSDTNRTHADCLLYTNQTTRTPRGTGKNYGPAEFAMVINVAGTRDGATGAGTGGWNALAGQMSPESATRANDPSLTGKRYMVEIGFVMSGFNPKMGWSPTFPFVGLSVSSTVPGGGNKVSSDTGTSASSTLPIRVAGGETLTILGGDLQVGANESRQLAKTAGGHGVLPYGGMGGPRVAFSPNADARAFARTRPVCIVTDGPLDLGAALTEDTRYPIRLMPMDGRNDFDILQAVDILLPPGIFSGIGTVQSTEATLQTLVAQYAVATGANFPDPRLVIRSFVLPHGDYRLTVTPARTDPDVFVPVNGYRSTRIAHSFYEMNSSPVRRPMANSTWNPMVGLMDPQKIQNYPMSNGNDNMAPRMTHIPFPVPNPQPHLTELNGMRFAAPNAVAIQSSSTNPARRATFSHARRDGYGRTPNRGSSDPFETGDFDTGPAALPDGPYMNYPDEGDRRRTAVNAYFRNMLFTAPKPTTEGIAGQNISPNFLVRSPVDFGSIPTGVANRVPWQTLRFRPDLGMHNLAQRMRTLADQPPPGMPFANFCGPRDHFFLDMFWMPVVEPWSISEPFSTKGTINLNQQIFPFLYVERTTALHALLRGERMYAIPNDAADRYKSVQDTTGAPNANQDATYRHFINPKETIRQMRSRFYDGKDNDPMPPGGNQLAFNVYRSASEICELWLVPENTSPIDNSRTLETIIGTVSASGEPQGFWADHKLTGDNLRERPYANLYPRVTVRSNVFKLHMVAQTLQKATSEDPKTFDSVKDSITAEWRGSCMIERSIDPRDPALTNIDYTNLNAAVIDPRTTPRLDRYYTYRVTEVKQLTQ